MTKKSIVGLAVLVASGAVAMVLPAKKASAKPVIKKDINGICFFDPDFGYTCVAIPDDDCFTSAPFDTENTFNAAGTTNCP